MFTVHGLTGEACNSMTPNAIKALALKHLNSDGKVLAVGHSDHLESIWNNPQLYPQMFSWLFPYGLGGIGMTLCIIINNFRQISISLLLPLVMNR